MGPRTRIHTCAPARAPSVAGGATPEPLPLLQWPPAPGPSAALLRKEAGAPAAAYRAGRAWRGFRGAERFAAWTTRAYLPKGPNDSERVCGSTEDAQQNSRARRDEIPCLSSPSRSALAVTWHFWNIQNLTARMQEGQAEAAALNNARNWRSRTRQRPPARTSISVSGRRAGALCRWRSRGPPGTRGTRDPDGK
ncbi:hypothetical protein H8959_002678 [Pygathrix nigripes]